ncbi:MAG: hypothetical protein KKI09_08735 [Spirochaetes bacterium]|nr:hypothetical protein [Spirochaetota bacterium]
MFTEIDNFDTEIEDYDDDTSNYADGSSDFDFNPDEPEIVEADSGAAPGFAESDTDPQLSGKINAKSADSLSTAQADDGLAIVDPDPERLAEQMERDLHRARAAAAGYPDNDTVPRKKIPVQEDEIGGPQGLYDPATGLCWESYLRERLGAELRRAASFEQDLVLLVASWDTVSKDSEDYALFASTVRDFFNFPDLSFGFGPDGVAVVLPNVDIDHAMRQTEELIKKLTFIIQNQAEELRYLEIFMGLSSRSGRIVDADRLIAETLVALKKARGERDTHIMAFRPDPERFRSYLTNR